MRITLVCGEQDERYISKKNLCVNRTNTLSDLRRKVQEHVTEGHRKRLTLYQFDPFVEIQSYFLPCHALGIRT